MLLVYRSPHTGWQQGGVPEEGKNRRTSSRFYFSHAFQAPSMTASPRDAVSATGPLCTHGKDKPGLGAPNFFKLLRLLLLFTSTTTYDYYLLLLLLPSTTTNYYYDYY